VTRSVPAEAPPRASLPRPSSSAICGPPARRASRSPCQTQAGRSWS